MPDDKRGREDTGKNKRAWRERQNSERAAELERDSEDEDEPADDELSAEDGSADDGSDEAD